ncbi:MAG: hypothetical protein GXO35_05240 [Gammaproteobacteria bacterium]|nr:hypothetical protein [Gammaproteobacteria bacterium]
MIREKWHDRIISELAAHLVSLEPWVTIHIHKGNARGSDIVVEVTKGLNKGRKINIEVQQFDSGQPWRQQTIPSWENRHDFLTIVVFPMPALERVRSRIPKVEAYQFFARDDVFLFSDSQISEILALIMIYILR